MELLAQFIDIVLHLDRHLVALVQEYGLWVYAILFAIIFSETGFVVTPFLPGEPAQLYDELYCARGEAENRIKEAQLGLFADRTSCHYFAANQFRLLLSSLAYVLVERLRALGLSGSEFARCQASTLRTKLLKIGAVIVRNTRRVRVMLSSAFPYPEIFTRAVIAVRSP